MRLIGMILVLVGGLALGYRGVADAGDGPGRTPAKTPGLSPSLPLMAGFAVTGGLLLITIGGGRREAR